MNKTIQQIVDIIDEAKCNPEENDSENCAKIIRKLVLSSLDTPELKKKLLDRPDRQKIARTPIETHKYLGKRYLTLDSIDQILALILKPDKPTINYGPGGKGANTFGAKPESHSPEPSQHHQKNVIGNI